MNCACRPARSPLYSNPRPEDTDAGAAAEAGAVPEGRSLAAMPPFSRCCTRSAVAVCRLFPATRTSIADAMDY